MGFDRRSTAFGWGRRSGVLGRGAATGRSPVASWGPFASGYLETAAGNGIRGNNVAWSFGIVFSKTADQGGAIDYITQCGLLASNRGWYVAITSAGAVVVRVHDGVGVLQTASVGTAVTDKWNAVVVSGGVDKIDCALNDPGSWTTASYTGYTAPDAADTHVIGARSAGATPFEFGRIAGAGGDDTTGLSAAQRDAWFASVKQSLNAGRGWTDLPAGTTHAWQAASVTDIGSVGGHNLTNNGAPSTAGVLAAAW